MRRGEEGRGTRREKGRGRKRREIERVGRGEGGEKWRSSWGRGFPTGTSAWIIPKCTYVYLGQVALRDHPPSLTVNTHRPSEVQLNFQVKWLATVHRGSLIIIASVCQT